MKISDSFLPNINMYFYFERARFSDLWKKFCKPRTTLYGSQTWGSCRVRYESFWVYVHTTEFSCWKQSGLPKWRWVLSLIWNLQLLICKSEAMQGMWETQNQCIFLVHVNMCSFLGSLFYSVDLGVCLGASSMLF